MKRSLLTLLAIGALGTLQAQTHDAGLELSAAYEQAIGRGLNLNIEEELRLTNMGTSYSKSETTLGIQYALLRNQLELYDMKMRVGADYGFINRLNKHHYYENQHRTNLNLLLSKRIGNWRIAWRCRWQTTFRNESRGDYKYNPQMYLRNRLRLSYKLPSKPYTLFVAAECFYRLNHPEKRIVDELRTRAGFSWQLDKHNSLEFFLKASNEIQVKNPDNLYLLGIGYSFD